MGKMEDYLERVKKVNIQKVGSYYSTMASNIKKEYYDEFDIDEDDLDYYVGFDIDEDIDKLIDESDYETDDFDEREFIDFVRQFLKEAEHYLVFQFGGNWLLQNGYKIADNTIDIFLRSYDCSQYINYYSKGKKVLSFEEYHHDRPTGFETLVIALTDKEYKDLSNSKHFEDIENFAMKYRKG